MTVWRKCYTTGVIIWRCYNANRVIAQRCTIWRQRKQSIAKRLGDREMVDILALVLHHDEQTVLCAVELALETGAPSL